MQTEKPFHQFVAVGLKAGMLAMLVVLGMAGCGGETGVGSSASNASALTSPGRNKDATTESPRPGRAPSLGSGAIHGVTGVVSQWPGSGSEGAASGSSSAMPPGGRTPRLGAPVPLAPVLPPKSPASLSGTVYGGLTPVSGATVTIYQAGDGYGSGSVALQSMITDSSGSFTVRFTPPATPKVLYVVALGGDAGFGNNAATGLMGVVGQSDNLPASVTINEFTTVAAEWALAQFADATGQVVGAPASNAVGFGNAVNQLGANLADIVSGGPAAFWGNQGASEGSCAGSSPPVNCDGLERLDTLANILAACVESPGPSSSACSALFGNTSTPSTGTTLEAAHAIATHPAANVSALFVLQSASPPFAPYLSGAPDGWEVALNLAPAGAAFNYPTDFPTDIAVDSAGDIWVTNYSGGSGCSPSSAPCGSISELTAASAYTTGRNFAPSGADLNRPFSITADSAGNIWAANKEGGSGCTSFTSPCGSVSELTASSRYATGLNFAPAGAVFDIPRSITLDGSGNVWTLNLESGSVSELVASGSYGAGLNFNNSTSPGANMNTPSDLAVDAAGNVWVVNGGSVSELVAASGYDAGVNFAAIGAAFSDALSVALDAGHNVWAANHLGGAGCLSGSAPCGSVSELTAASSYAAGRNFAPPGAALNGPLLIALDSAGNVWLANTRGGSGCSSSSAPCGSASELTAASGYSTGLNFAPGGAGFITPHALALDPSGNVWVLNNSGGGKCIANVAPCLSVAELIGLAAPVLTPPESCLKRGQSVCLP